MRKIVTHINPDLDAVASVWLIKRFLPGWDEVEIAFCQPQATINGQPVDSNPEILHVDVGEGKLDHHQTGEYLSAAQLCFDYVKKERKGKQLSPLNQEALERLVAVVTEIDNARDLSWPEVNTNRHDFYLHNLIWGIRGIAKSDQEAMEYGIKGLDAVLHGLKTRIQAEEEIKNGIEFETPWGSALAIKSGNALTTWEAEKKGYCLAVRKDPETGAVRIYSRHDCQVDLTEAYNKFKKMDPESDWFLHATKRLLLNESSGKEMRPTKLSLKEIIEVLKKQESTSEVPGSTPGVKLR